AEMRKSDPPVQYLAGTPKGRLTRLEKQLIGKPWQEARQGVQVKLLAVFIHLAPVSADNQPLLR
ncbi:MAG TPA: hypothetical protein VEF36_03495, partial [Roseiarcus sp.]|nr:hypothetical protein [Roseiarcus sp.]